MYNLVMKRKGTVIKVREGDYARVAEKEKLGFQVINKEPLPITDDVNEAIQAGISAALKNAGIQQGADSGAEKVVVEDDGDGDGGDAEQDPLDGLGDGSNDEPFPQLDDSSAKGSDLGDVYINETKIPQQKKKPWNVKK